MAVALRVFLVALKTVVAVDQCASGYWSGLLARGFARAVILGGNMIPAGARGGENCAGSGQENEKEGMKGASFIYAPPLPVRNQLPNWLISNERPMR